jgi:GAF domain-containing protein
MSKLFAEQFAATARELANKATVEDALTAIARKAVDTVPGAEHAGITLERPDGKYVTVAATDELATRVDAIQYQTNEGPCVWAMTIDRTFETPDLSTDTRWPTFGPRAVRETGVVSMLSHRLFIEENTALGALNLYSRQRGAFTTVSAQTLTVLAAHCAIALGRVAAQAENEHLRHALESNRNVGIAMGILMANHRVTKDQAFDLLRVSSQHSHRKLVDIALEVIDTGRLDPSLIDRSKLNAKHSQERTPPPR